MNTKCIAGKETLKHKLNICLIKQIKKKKKISAGNTFLSQIVVWCMFLAFTVFFSMCQVREQAGLFFF